MITQIFQTNNAKSVVFLLIILFIGQPLFAQKKNKKKNKEIKTDLVLEEKDEIQAERLFIDGQLEKFLGNIEEAYALFSKSLEYNPKLDGAYFELAQIQQIAGDLVSAQKSMDEALTLSPKNNWYLEYKADLFAFQYDYNNAASIYDKLIQQQQNNYQYYYKKAYFQILAEELNEAIQTYDDIEKQIGPSPESSLQKFKIYARLNENQKAIQTLEQLIDIFPNELDFQNKLAEFYLANGDEEKASEWFENILTIDPNNIQALTTLSDFYQSQGNDEKALYYSKRAFENPAIPVDAKIAVLYNYIKYYDQNKDKINDAFDLTDILIKAHPSEAKVYAIAGDLKYLNNDNEDALSYYYQSLEQRKDVFTVWQQVFFILSDQQNYEELIDVSNDAKEYFPNQAQVYFFNGMAYQFSKDLDKAEKAYIRGSKMTGDNIELEAQFYSNLGDLYNDKKEFKNSDDYFEKALQLKPNNAYVLNNYSYYLSLRKEQLDKAKSMSKLAVDLSPGNSSFLDTHAWVLFQKGEYEEALKFQEKAISFTAEDNATLLEHYGDILIQLGKTDKALDAWKKAAELDAENSILLQKINTKKYHE